MNVRDKEINKKYIVKRRKTIALIALAPYSAPDEPRNPSGERENLPTYVVEVDKRGGICVAADGSAVVSVPGRGRQMVPCIFRSSSMARRKFSRRNHSQLRLNLNLAPPPALLSPLPPHLCVFSRLLSIPLFPRDVSRVRFPSWTKAGRWMLRLRGAAAGMAVMLFRSGTNESARSLCIASVQLAG